MLRHFFFLSCVAVCTFPATGAPTIWTPASGGNGHAYEVKTAPGGISWDNARTAALAAHGDLASITSDAENSFVFALTDSTTYWYNYDNNIPIGPWLGGFQLGGSPEPAGGWQWVSGEPFVYTNWAAGQPDNFSGEDRLHFHVPTVVIGRGPTWNDIQNNGGVLPHAYVIEYVPEPGSLVTLSCLTAGVLAFRRRHKQ